MSIVRSIKRNKELEPYFLDFYEYSTLLENTNDDPKLVAAHLESLESLVDTLTNMYNIQGDKDVISDIIEEVLNYYLSIYSFEQILEKNKNRRLKENKINNKKLTRAFDEKASFCIECHSLRKVLNFEDLSADAKLSFESEKFKADYFLYCAACDSYSMMYKHGII